MIHGKDITSLLKDKIDILSISLNTPNAEEYYKLTRNKFGIQSFQAMLDFAKEAKNDLSSMISTIKNLTPTGRLERQNVSSNSESEEYRLAQQERISELQAGELKIKRNLSTEEHQRYKELTGIIAKESEALTLAMRNKEIAEDIAATGGLATTNVKAELNVLKSKEKALENIKNSVEAAKNSTKATTVEESVLLEKLGKQDQYTKNIVEQLKVSNKGRIQIKDIEELITKELEAQEDAQTAINELQKALPTEYWFDGKMDLSEFSDYIDDFGTAMSDFGSKASEINSTAVSTVISTAYRIKNLITSLVDLDTSGVEDFTGIGTGGIGADGPAYDIAKAIAKFGEEASEIDNAKVSSVISSAQRLKSFINSLSGLDASGIANFKPKDIGEEMKKYSDKVSDIDNKVVSSSITSASRLKNFIGGLSGLDTRGINNFKIGSIGSSLKSYASSVSSFNVKAVSTSIIAANRLRSFIVSLAELNSNGVNSFKNAIDQLSTVNIGNFVKAFSGASGKLSTVGVDIIKGLINGIESRIPQLKIVASNLATSMNKSIKSKISIFSSSGQELATKLANGFSSKNKSVTSVISSSLSSATTAIRNKYTSFYSAGSYLVTGFSNGISENSYKAAAKAKAMAEAAIKAARNALKINSPSKVFKEIGSGIPEGFAIGIGMLGGTVKNSVTDMASTAIKSTRSAMATVLDALNSDMDAQPTIRPVIDLTDVRSGASAINGMLSGTQGIGVQANLNAINVAMNRKLQNGNNDDIISAINKLNDNLEGTRGDTYNFAGITYDNGDEISNAVQTLVRAAKMGRRV